MVDLKKKYGDKDRLRLYRQKMGKTQDEFAQMVGVASSTVRNWETGAGSIPGPMLTLIRIGEETGVYPAPTTEGSRMAVSDGAEAYPASPDEAAVMAMCMEDRVAWALEHPADVMRMGADAKGRILKECQRSEERLSDRSCLDEALDELEWLRGSDPRYKDLSLGDILAVKAVDTLDALLSRRGR